MDDVSPISSTIAQVGSGTSSSILTTIAVNAPDLSYLSSSPIKVAYRATLQHSTQIQPAYAEVFFYINTINPCVEATVTLNPDPLINVFKSISPAPVLEAYVRSQDSIDLDVRTGFVISSNEPEAVCGAWNYLLSYDPQIQDTILTTPEPYMLSVWAQQESTMGEYDVTLKVWQGAYENTGVST